MISHLGYDRRFTDDVDKQETTIQGRKSSMKSKMQGTISDQFQDTKSGELAAGLWASQRIREPAASEEERTEKDMSLGQDFA